MKLTSKTKMRIGMSIMIVPFICFLLSLFSLTFTAEGRSENIALSFVGFSMLAMVIGSIFGFIIANPVAKREERLKSQKQRIYANICFDALLNGNYQKAEFVFNKCLKSSDDRGFIRGLYLGMQLRERKSTLTKERSKEIILSYKYTL